jgi:HK97 gp10 family phage protein
MKFSHQITGTSTLKGVIASARRNAPRQTTQVVKSNAEEIKKTARRLAPKDSWFMHDNIYTRHEGMKSIIHSPAPYSGYVENGTRFMDAQPFMFPAVEEQQEKFNKDLQDVMDGVFV